jgi:hypothetical protein
LIKELCKFNYYPKFYMNNKTCEIGGSHRAVKTAVWNVTPCSLADYHTMVLHLRSQHFPKRVLFQGVNTGSLSQMQGKNSDGTHEILQAVMRTGLRKTREEVTGLRVASSRIQNYTRNRSWRPIVL